jgi:processive 1,2-diacylglycerol beta-glucosyltransferase
MKRIDIYTIDIGGGHIAPAQAIKKQFDILGHKDLEVRVVNLGTALPTTFLRLVYKTYWDLALRYPPLINAFYQGADNPFVMKIVDKLMGIAYLPKFVAYLEREKPDLVVSTYFTFTHYLETLKQVGQCDAITVMLNPEPFDSHYIWFSKAFDWSMVFSRKSFDEVVAKGFPESKLRLFPFPIKPGVARRAEPPEALRSRLGLARRPFTVLLFFGAEGVGPVKRYLKALIERGLALQAVVVCGRNAQLKADLEALAAGPTGALHIEVRGYVTNLSEYMSAADVVVGKSGPNQVLETLLQERPIIISSFLANERETTDWVIGNRVGWLTRTPSHLAERLAGLMKEPQVLEEYRRNIRGLKLRSGAPDICDFLYGLLKEKRKPKPRPMADALRKLKEKMAAQGEELTRRIESTEGVRRIKKAAAASHRKQAARRSAGRSVRKPPTPSP